VFGLDPDLLGMIPQPVLALIILYPPAIVSAATTATDTEKKADSTTSTDATTSATAPSTAQPATATATTATSTSEAKVSDGKEPFYMVQVAALSNACGTVAALHAMANLNISGRMPLSTDSILSRWIAAARKLTPAARGESLDANAEIEQAHSKLAGSHHHHHHHRHTITITHVKHICVCVA
jgi:hypothetical protein